MLNATRRAEPEIVAEGGYVVLAGRRFGIVDLHPPADSDLARRLDETGRSWSGWDSCGWGFTVPMENGAMVDLRWDHEEGLSLHLGAPFWALDPIGFTGEHAPIACWVTTRWAEEGRPVICIGGPRFASWIDRHVWSGCDQEWAAEHIERLSHMRFIDLVVARLNPRMQFRPIPPRP